MKGNILEWSLYLPGNRPVRSAIRVLMNNSYGKNPIKEDWSMEHWLWQLRWRQGPLGMHDYKENGLLTRVGCIRARRSWCPRRMSANRYRKGSKLPMPPPRARRRSLWLYTGRVCSAAMRETQKQKDERKNRSRWGKRQKGIGTDRVSAWNFIRGTGNTSICSPVLWC